LLLLLRRFLAFCACDEPCRLPSLPNPQSPEANVMGEELWYVKLANGDVHRVTIDQLDGAFQAGHIDESTMVLAAGASQWTKLGDLAGLDNESTSDAQAAAPEAPATEDQAHENPAQEEEEELSYIPQVQAAPAPSDEVLDYVPQRPPPAYVQQAKPSPAPQDEAPAGYIPQRPPPGYVQQVAPRTVTAPVSAAPSYAPPAQGTPYAVSISAKPPALAAAPLVPNSLRPMSMDLGDFDDVQYPRKSRTGRFVAAVVALAAIAGGVGFAAQRAHFTTGSSSDLSSVAAAAAVAAPPPVTEPVVAPPPPAPAPPPVAATPSPSPASAAPAGASPMNPQFTSRLNEDTVKKLVAADKARETKTKARHSSGGGSNSSTPRSKSSNFTTGGNKFDPLNSSI
jgi:hypothetical protein